MGRRFDLHAHSNVSDGSLTPEALVALAREKGLAGIALTDHDHVGGVARARRTGTSLGVEVVAGVELSVDAPRGQMHLLGYFIDPHDTRLAARLEELRERRATRNARIVAKLNALGIAVSLDEIVREAGARDDPTKSVGRPHIASVLVAKGAASSVEDAFGRYLGEGKAAHVPKEKLSPEDAVALVRAAGGAAVLAHPFTLPADARAPALERLASLGLAGVEVAYPRHDANLRDELMVLARRFDLVATAGSDFHGKTKPDVALGAESADSAVVEALKSRTKR